MKSWRTRQALKSDINMTPLVDVMLVLLVVFMVSAPMMTKGVVVNLPKASGAPLPQEEPLVLTIKSNREIFLQEEPIVESQLGRKIKGILQNNPQARIQIRGDKGLGYGEIMEVITQVTRAGCYKVSLVTES